jgi:hypothetical protein
MGNDELVRRNEFKDEVRGLRSDIKEHAKTITNAMERLAGDIKETEHGWRDRTHALGSQIQKVVLHQAIQSQQIEALEESPSLQAVKEALDRGFGGVNARLDKVNGRLDTHTGQIAGNTAKIDILELHSAQTPTELSTKTKVTAGTVGGVGLLAVLYSLFEMIKAFGPDILKIFK